MEREDLERYLADGLSLEEIGRRTRRHPATVGYWVRKHGLEAVHRARHAPRGGIHRGQLEELAERGATIRAMAEALGVSATTVRYWLARHGLRTVATDARKRMASARTAGKATVRRTCRRHGLTEFGLEGRSYYRCLRCRAEAVADRRRRVKELLVREAGGRCACCGYSRFAGALEFHHLNPAEKRFGLGSRGLTRSLAILREEARTCVLLCSNCHAEVEGGVVTLDL